MLTIALSMITVCLCLMAYLMNIFMGWELIYVMVLAAPLWLYYKSDKTLWNEFLVIQSLMVVVRIIAVTILGRRCSYFLSLPISFEQPIVSSWCGTVQSSGWLLWFVIIGLHMLATVELKSRNMTKVKQLESDHTINRISNVFLLTSIAIVMFHITTIIGYNMKSVAINIYIQIGLIIVLTVSAFMMKNNILNRRLKEIYNKNGKELEEVPLSDK